MFEYIFRLIFIIVFSGVAGMAIHALIVGKVVMRHGGPGSRHAELVERSIQARFFSLLLLAISVFCVYIFSPKGIEVGQLYMILLMIIGLSIGSFWHRALVRLFTKTNKTVLDNPKYIKILLSELFGTNEKKLADNVKE